MELVSLVVAIAAASVSVSAVLVAWFALRVGRETDHYLRDIALSIENRSINPIHDASYIVTSELREVVRLSVREAVHDVAANEQAWFWLPSWQQGEREADLEIARGEGVVFDSDDSFESFLREQPAADDPVNVTNKG